MIHYLIAKIGMNRGAPRVYLQNRRLERAGFIPGARYAATTAHSSSHLVLRVDRAGQRTVSVKRRGEREYPVIDINAGEHLAAFEGLDAVRVVIYASEIHIMPLATEVMRSERIDAAVDTVLAGEPLTVGSLSHGVGVLSHAVHHGLKDVGLDVELAFANEIRDELADQACEKNAAWSHKTIGISAPMQEFACDAQALAALPRVTLLEAGLPCSGASVAGRSKRHLSCPEAHPEVGHLVAAFLQIIAKVNPLVIVFENVVQYRESASGYLMRQTLRDRGYEIHEATFRGGEWGVLEDRKRYAMVAVTRGVSFDFGDMHRPAVDGPRITVGDILEDVPADDPRWSRMEGLKRKLERDVAAGKGFRMSVAGAGDTRLGTLTKGIKRNRSTDPKIQHPENPDLLRVPTPAEHARAMGIPVDLVDGLSDTLAHEALGQSVTYPAFRELAAAIGRAILTFASTRRGQAEAAAHSAVVTEQFALA